MFINIREPATSLELVPMTRPSQPIKRLALKLLLLLTFSSSTAAGLLVVAGCTATATPARVPPPATVTVVESKRMTVPIIVNPIGTTRALEEVTIRARVKGFLTKQHFQYGTNVKKGHLLLVIDDEPFKVQVDQAKAQLEGATASLEKAQSSKSVEISKASLAVDQAQFRLDEVEERRERILLARKAASQEDYDQAEAQKKKSAAKVEADQASLDQTEADYKIDIATAQADVDKAQAALEDARINLGYCKMFAPIDGRIGELKVKVGNLVGDAGATELVTIQQLDPMGLDLHPPARYLPEATALLPTGVAVDLTVEGERRHPHVGKAIFIDNLVDEQTSTFLLRAEVDNPMGTVLPGEYIRATMTVGRVRRRRGRSRAGRPRGAGRHPRLRGGCNQQSRRGEGAARSTHIEACACSSRGSSRVRRSSSRASSSSGRARSVKPVDAAQLEQFMREDDGSATGRPPLQ